MPKKYSGSLKNLRIKMDDADIHAIRMARGRATMRELSLRYHKSVPTIQAIQTLRIYTNVEITDEERALSLTPVAELRNVDRDKLKQETQYVKELHKLVDHADSMLMITTRTKYKLLRELEPACETLAKHLRAMLPPTY